MEHGQGKPDIELGIFCKLSDEPVKSLHHSAVPVLESGDPATDESIRIDWRTECNIVELLIGSHKTQQVWLRWRKQNFNTHRILAGQTIIG